MGGRRPRIAITLRHELETERFYLGRDYADAVEAAGGVPLYVSLIPRREYVETLLEVADGVLLPGSASDVDPLRYGREPHRGLGEVHPLKDETDALVLEEVERRALPLLAICYGMQALNVSRGGTLIQDIGTQLPEAFKHQQGAPRGRHSHTVTLLKGGLPHGLCGAEELPVNSHHHQAVETLGENLRATAWAKDGLIEAFEDVREGRWVNGVQWHPEIGWADDRFSQGLFSTFVRAAYDFARVQERENPPREEEAPLSRTRVR